MIGDSWNGRPKGDGLAKKMLGRVKPDMPLSKKIEYAQKRLEVPISHLRAIDEKLQAKADQLFERIVSAQRIHNNTYAQMYANELVQVRKMKGMVSNAKLSMEQIQLRLNTVSELGDIVVTLSPCMSVIKDLSPSISGMVPEASTSMQDLSGLMGELISSSRMESEETLSVDNLRNRDAMDILDEVHSAISEEVQAVIPKVPDSLSAASEPETPHNILPEVPDDTVPARSRTDEMIERAGLLG